MVTIVPPLDAKPRVDIGALRTLAFIAVVFGNQATTYTNRERRHLWSSRPSIWLVVSSIADRLDVGHWWNCNDGITGLDRGRHACRRGWIRRCFGFCEGPGFSSSWDHLKKLEAAGRTNMKIHSKDFRVRQGDEVALKKWPTKVDPVYKSKEQYQELLKQHVAQLSSQQQLLYASNRYAILLIFQAMDAAGKDGAIAHVMSGVNPQGCQVFSFKHPSPKELQHDFLWRTTRELPERGRIGIFNRSYYEEVLIARVHPEILRSEAIPGTPDHDRKVWHDRYRSITNLERHLYGNGTRIIKFYLHLSKEEQRKRFLARIDEPEKNWKFSAADIAERKYWKEYIKAFEECLTATSTRIAPWYVVPADDKEHARLIVSRIVLDTFEELKMTYPKTSAQRRRELLSIRKQLTK
jgi:PPK2 family polyphosphate:nucleotide phosphotransferase